MKKQDLIIIGLLFALMLAWPYLYSRLFPQAPAKPRTIVQNLTHAVGTGAPTVSAESSPLQPVPSATVLEPAMTRLPDQATTPTKPEQRITVTNAEVSIIVSSWGGSIIAVECKNYRGLVDRHSDPVVLDFSNHPALVYCGLPGFSSTNDFEIRRDPSGSAICISKTTPEGCRFSRTITLSDRYQLKVQDVFLNEGTQAFTLPEHEILVGPMRMTGSETRTMGLDYLGVDALPASGGEGVAYWAGKIPKLFKTEMKERQLPGLPEFIRKNEEAPIDWVAAKSKFFVQILAPEGGAAGYRLRAERTLVPGEDRDPGKIPKNADIRSVSASALFSDKTLNPGESLTREMSYYAGPKKLSVLKRLGLHQEEVMDFGMWSPVCKFLLTVLNITYTIIPNYGIAIIILTILIRILFWPLTHKSTESMKKMQELQPLMMAIRAKHKDHPKKMQEETLALYRKHKVNPMSGCLPMLIQIPVFIALFIVLRSAIELRFADFLWIRDLSEPERLLAGLLPIPLNILPIFMAATMAWQQKLMPTTDPNQQKMMLIFMPVMMLVMFYNMPSALVLYWSTNQCIMIVQQLIQKKRLAMKQQAVSGKP